MVIKLRETKKKKGQGLFLYSLSSCLAEATSIGCLTLTLTAGRMDQFTRTKLSEQSLV
jgi:hypothetical protein